MTTRHAIRPARIALFALLTVFTVTCGGDSGTGPADDGGGEQPRELTIALAASQGMSTDRIVVTGIPDDVENVYALITLPSGKTGELQQEEGAIAVIDRSGEDDELIVPLHPDAPMTGGPVDVSVTNGSNVSSNTVRLDIDPLPAAPGAFGALVDSLQVLLDRWFEQTGTSRQDFIDMPAEELSLYDLPALFVFHLVDHPDNPNSLRAMADGDIPLFEGEPVDRDVLDAITAASGLRDMLAEKLEYFGTLTTPEVPDPPAAGAAFRAARSSSQQCISAPRFDIGPDDCALLAEIMSYQSQLELEAASAVEKYKGDLVKAGLSLMTYARAAQIAAGIGSSLWAVESIEEGHKGLYPSDFISSETTVTLDTQTFPEDFTQPGKWSEFKVSAISQGWNFEKRVKEAFEQVYSAAGGFDAPTPNPQETFRQKYDGMVKNQLSKNAKKKFQEDDNLDLEYCAQEWHAIDCTGLPHSSGKSSSLDVDPQNLTYEPKEVGTATLQIGTEPVFGLGRETIETFEITTELLEISIDPFQAEKDVEEVQAFFAHVNAANPEVDWDIVWPGPDNFGVLSEDGNNAEVFTPPNPWMTPIELIAKSTSNTGLRKDKVDTDPRTDSAFITWAGGPRLKIDPGYKCLSPGDPPFKFTAHVEGIEDYTVIWKLVEGYGQIDQNGFYTPVSMGQTDDVISAELEEFPEVKDIATVRVGACTCNYRIEILGTITYEGGDIAYQRSNFGGEYIYTFFIEIDDGTDAAIGMSLGPTEEGSAPDPGQTGPYALSMSYLPPGGGAGWVTGENSGVTLNILEHKDAYMIATLSGTLEQGEPPNQTIISVSGSFRAGRWADQGWPCE